MAFSLSVACVVFHFVKRSIAAMLNPVCRDHVIERPLNFLIWRRFRLRVCGIDARKIQALRWGGRLVAPGTGHACELEARPAAARRELRRIRTRQEPAPEALLASWECCGFLWQKAGLYHAKRPPQGVLRRPLLDHSRCFAHDNKNPVAKVSGKSPSTLPGA
jgi:hypothetical protein